ncbi:tRNA lysidine(34) synthetase TilS [Stieleria varia]|uniref:tRNA(Ile)-lysidine synthase n=1 Tax=Stieleria varia TaxID=2528005 RepID=A0A5C6B594_9BACT|nr:tRNA lysidine(34) synthetase TilS [Stieleria varia]TWU07465.1 tRNA(Ile)-lysidine synthase [Stieleria varia]
MTRSERQDSFPPHPDTPPDAWDSLVTEFRAAWPVGRWESVGVVVGCSGGADSVALLRLMAAVRNETSSNPNSGSRAATGFLVAAHFHHGLRGHESDGDAEFVAELARELGCRFELALGDGIHSDEANLRDHRRAFLQRTASRRGCRYIALAHSLDDNVETVLHHLLRGSGPTGLAGIAPYRSYGHEPEQQDLVWIRPLLNARRDQIREALRSRGFSWREDASNEDDRYRRNWIRHQLMPLIEAQFPDASNAIARAANTQREMIDTIDALADQWIERFVIHESPLTIRRTESDEPPAVDSWTIAQAALRTIWARQQWPLGEMSMSHWRAIAAALPLGPDAVFMLPGDLRCVAKGDQIVITKTHARAEIELQS